MTTDLQLNEIPCSRFEACQKRLEELSPPHAIDLGLDRVRLAAAKLNLFNADYTLITVAGTNGKGSTVATLEAIYSAAGYRCGSYTSPHLNKLNERIKVNQKPISDECFADALSVVFECCDFVALTYFEILTLAAVYHFKQQGLDIVILEVGMGGRLDATNIFDADLAVITSIALDHQAYLGNSLDEIAFEKAGILRNNQLFIYADHSVSPVIRQQSEEKNCRKFFLDEDYFLCESAGKYQLKREGLLIEINSDKVHPQNAAAAVLASQLLNSRLPIKNIDIKKGLEAIDIPCRRQYIPGDLPHLLDVAHNPQSTALLATTLAGLSKSTKIHAVFSCLKDKNLSEMLMPLRDCIQHWYPAQLENERGVDAEEIYQYLYQLKLDTQPVKPAKEAYKQAVQQAKKGELIVVFGSFYLLSELLDDIERTTIINAKH